MARVVIVMAVVLAGCGPIAYVSEVTHRAERSIDAARTAEAERYAPYYWTRATQYLHEAHENAAHADFQGANRFGRLAAEAGQLAEQEAIAAKQDPKRRPLDGKPEVAPAKEPR
ncbi:MAG: hypothetical protein H6Q90_2451 [Deltaproteobacteria bacterium]|nr:hypothetical protein [Deltaproteobacteria bacterium]